MISQEELKIFLGTSIQSKSNEDTNPAFIQRALALIVKHKIKDVHKKQNCLVLGGTNDLHAQLQQLDLSKNGSEAFIVMMPYIHVEGIYLRRVKNQLRCFWIDSQAWGERYYPNRNTLEILYQCCPGIEVITSGTELQSQNNQRSCFAHILNFMEYAAQNGKEIFEYSDQRKTELYTYQCNGKNLQVLPSGDLPFDIIKFAENEQDIKKYLELYPSDSEKMLSFRNQPSSSKNPTINLSFAQYIDCLQKDILPMYLDEESHAINLAKINAVVKEMQGFNASNEDDIIKDDNYQIYKIKAIYENGQCKLIITFPNKDQLIYGNCLLYSNAIYPKSVSINNQTVILNENKSLDKNSITTFVDEQTLSIVYTAPSFQVLIKTFNEILRNDNYFDDLFINHMRQTFALKCFLHTAKNSLCLEEIKTNGKGGLQLNEITGALIHLTKECFSAYVTNDYLNKVEQDGKILKQIDDLKKEINLFLIPYAITESHCILITINQKTKKISVYDSGQTTVSLEEITLLKSLKIDNFFDEHKISVTISPYGKQADNWECPIHVIQIAVDLVDGIQYKDLMALDINNKLNYFWHAYKAYQKTDVNKQDYLEGNLQKKIILLDVIQTIRRKKEYQSDDALQSLGKALKIELWGYDFKETETDRIPIRTDIIRKRPLSMFIKKFSDDKKSDFCSYLLEQIATLKVTTHYEVYLKERIEQILSEKEHVKKDLYKIRERLKTNIAWSFKKQELTTLLANFNDQKFDFEEIIGPTISIEDIDISILKGMYKRLIQQHLEGKELKKTDPKQKKQEHDRVIEKKVNALNSRIAKIEKSIPGINNNFAKFLAEDSFGIFQIILREIKPDDLIKDYTCEDLSNIMRAINNGNEQIYIKNIVTHFFDKKFFSLTYATQINNEKLLELALRVKTKEIEEFLLQNNKPDTSIHQKDTETILNILSYTNNLDANIYQRAFFIAISMGYEDRAMQLINDNKININQKNISNEHPLTVALKHNNAKIINCLLQNSDLDLNICNEEMKRITDFLLKNNVLENYTYQNVLSIAIAMGFEGLVISWITNNKIDVTQINDSIEHPLIIALKHKREKVITLLQQHNFDPSICQAALPIAISNGFEDIAVQWIVNDKVNINQINNLNEHPFIIALKNTRTKIVALLKNNDFSPEIYQTAFPIAIKKGFEEIAIQWINENKVNINQRDQSKEHPLTIALYKNRTKTIICLLLNKNLDRSIYRENIKDIIDFISKHNDLDKSIYQNTFPFAIEGDFEDIVIQWLDDNTVNIHQIDDAIEHPLVIALKHKRKKIVSIMQRYDFDQMLYQKAFPIAIKKGFEEIAIQWATNRKININQQDDLGNYPLILALEHDRNKVIDFLIDNPEFDQSLFQIALPVAIREGFDNLTITWLQENKIDINQSDISGKHPLVIALECGRNKTVQFIIKDSKLAPSSYQAAFLAAIKNTYKSTLNTVQNFEYLAVQWVNEKGIDINKLDDSGNHPLILALTHKRKKLVELLANNPSLDLNICKKAFSLAIKNGFEELAIKWLEQDLVDINQRDDKNRHPYIMALENKRNNVRKVLSNNIRLDKNIFHLEAVSIIIEKEQEDISSEWITNQTTQWITDRSVENNKKSLFNAVIKNHLNVCKLLLTDKRIDINEKNSDNHTLLKLAAWSKHHNLEIAKLFLSNEALNQDSIYGTLYSLIPDSKYEDEYIIFIENIIKHVKIDFDKINSENENLLDVAVRSTDSEVIQLLLTCDSLTVTHFQKTFEKFRDSERCITLLIECGCKSSNPDICYKSFLLADENDYKDYVLFAINNTVFAINHSDTNYKSPLLRALYKQNLEIFKALLSHESINEDSCQTALISAIESRDLDYYSRYIDYVCPLLNSKKVSVSKKDKNGNSAIHYAAAATNKHDIVYLLVEHGANVNELNNSGEFPLLIALKKKISDANSTNSYSSKVTDDLNIFTILIKYGANVKQLSQSGESLLLIAVQAGQADIARLLIQAGAELNIAIIAAVNNNEVKQLFVCIHHILEAGELLNNNHIDTFFSNQYQHAVHYELAYKADYRYFKHYIKAVFRGEILFDSNPEKNSLKFLKFFNAVLEKVPFSSDFCYLFYSDGISTILQGKILLDPNPEENTLKFNTLLVNAKNKDSASRNFFNKMINEFLNKKTLLHPNKETNDELLGKLVELDVLKQMPEFKDLLGKIKMHTQDNAPLMEQNQL